MGRAMHENSLEVHQRNLELKKYPKQVQMIVESLEFIGEGTMHSIANHLRVPLNTISGRFKKMRENGLIKAIGKTNNNRTIWKLQKNISQTK